MESSYLYFGLGIVSVFVLAGIAIAFLPQQQNIEAGSGETSKMTLAPAAEGESYSAYFSEEKLFSGTTETIMFSSVENSGEKIECDIACRKN